MGKAGRRELRGAAVLGGAMALLLATSNADAYEIWSKISPSITAQPVEVVYWVVDGVSASDETASIAAVDQALQAWEDVPTACVSFHKNRVVHSATQPAKASTELMAVIANPDSNVGFAGGGLPAGGNPQAFRIPANLPSARLSTALHEAGHTLGFNHSSVSWSDRSVLHFASSATTLQPDDIAAVSLNYPCAQAPLSAVTGGVYGMLLSQYEFPVSGVNVIVVNTSTNAQVIARITGQMEEGNGEFMIDGIPPGTYRLEFRGAESFAGGHLPPDYGQPWLGGFQRDNFTPFASANFTISAGQTIDFGEITLNIDEVNIDGVASALGMGYANPTTWLASGQTGQAYSQYLHIHGGLRDLSLVASGVPSGLSVDIVADPNGEESGRALIRVSGTPTQAGLFAPTITVYDAQGRIKIFTYNLSIGPLGSVGLVARYDFSGSTTQALDSSGNGHHGALVGTQPSDFVNDRFGYYRGALSLHPSAYVQLPDEAAFDLAAYSLVMRLRLPAVGWQDEWLISKAPYGVGGFGLWRSGVLGGYGLFGHQTAGNEWAQFFSGDPLPVNQQFCAAVTLGAAAADTYVDGVLQAHLANPPAPVFNDAPVRIGLGGDVALDTYMQGVVDDVLIFKGKLTQAQIQAVCR